MKGKRQKAEGKSSANIWPPKWSLRFRVCHAISCWIYVLEIRFARKGEVLRYLGWLSDLKVRLGMVWVKEYMERLRLYKRKKSNPPAADRGRDSLYCQRILHPSG
jgi:hypothetical protein